MCGKGSEIRVAQRVLATTARSSRTGIVMRWVKKNSRRGRGQDQHTHLRIHAKAGRQSCFVNNILASFTYRKRKIYQKRRHLCLTKRAFKEATLESVYAVCGDRRSVLARWCASIRYRGFRTLHNGTFVPLLAFVLAPDREGVSLTRAPNLAWQGRFAQALAFRQHVGLGERKPSSIAFEPLSLESANCLLSGVSVHTLW